MNMINESGTTPLKNNEPGLTTFKNNEIGIDEKRFLLLLKERGLIRAIDDLKDSIILIMYKNSKHSAETARKLKMNRTSLIYYLYQMGIKPCEKRKRSFF